MKLKKQKGFTLVEVIIGLAILGIISIIIIPIFTNSVINIYRSGRRTDSVFTVQENIETKSADFTSSEILAFDFGDYNINIPIILYTFEESYDKTSKLSITVFEADLSGFNE